MSIETFLQQQYPGNGRRQVVRDEIANVCNAFVRSGLADANFTTELCSGSDQKFWSRVSEALLAARLSSMGLYPVPFSGGGPDFLLIDNERKIWIEVICPLPKGVPSDWLTFEPNKVVTFPHEQILLRWTSAIKEKADKLIGNLDGTDKGYIEKGIVSSRDAYVIAVNGRHLRNGPFPALSGISQFPFAVEAVFALGPCQITIDRNTLKRKSVGHQTRPQIFKPIGDPVPTDIFLDARFRLISAIWAVDVDGTSSIGNPEPMAVIHNPYADNKIPIGFLPAHDEYQATHIGTEMLELNMLKGRLG